MVDHYKNFDELNEKEEEIATCLRDLSDLHYLNHDEDSSKYRLNFSNHVSLKILEMFLETNDSVLPVSVRS